MKRILTLTPAIVVLASATLLVNAKPAAADGWEHRHHYGHYARIAYADYGPYSGSCRTGWWQTLRYGHVRPVWGSWCR